MLDFERPIFELEKKIKELENFGSDKDISIEPDLKNLNETLTKLKEDIYSNLTPWQRVQIARHPDRPYTLDYIRMMTTDFMEIHGDREFADDLAIVGGFAKIDDQPVIVLGHEKGRDTKDKIKRNFGCAHPEGYRKAMRIMRLGEKFHLPIVVFIDTQGAYPGIGAEERGVAQAIAQNLRDMASLETPVIATVIGEGGSGGAIGIGVADVVCILEHAYYSVISPEGCASILWRNAVKAPDAAQALKFTGEHLIKFNIVDEIIPEPQGGVHHDPVVVAEHLKKVILTHIDNLSQLSKQELLDRRYAKFRAIGAFSETMQNDSTHQDDSKDNDKE